MCIIGIDRVNKSKEGINMKAQEIINEVGTQGGNIMIAYKLTNSKYQTHNNTQWGVNITHEVNEKHQDCIILVLLFLHLLHE